MPPWKGLGLRAYPEAVDDALSRKLDCARVCALIGNAEDRWLMGKVAMTNTWDTYMLFHLTNDSAALLSWVNAARGRECRTYDWKLAEGSLLDLWETLPTTVQRQLITVPLFRLKEDATPPDGLAAAAAVIDTVELNLLSALPLQPVARTHNRYQHPFDLAWALYLNSFYPGKRLWVERTDKNRVVHKEYTQTNVSTFYND